MKFLRAGRLCCAAALCLSGVAGAACSSEEPGTPAPSNGGKSGAAGSAGRSGSSAGSDHAAGAAGDDGAGDGGDSGAGAGGGRAGRGGSAGEGGAGERGAGRGGSAGESGAGESGAGSGGDGSGGHAGEAGNSGAGSGNSGGNGGSRPLEPPQPGSLVEPTETFTPAGPGPSPAVAAAGGRAVERAFQEGSQLISAIFDGQRFVLEYDTGTHRVVFTVKNHSDLVLADMDCRALAGSAAENVPGIQSSSWVGTDAVYTSSRGICFGTSVFLGTTLDVALSLSVAQSAAGIVF